MAPSTRSKKARRMAPETAPETSATFSRSTFFDEASAIKWQGEEFGLVRRPEVVELCTDDTCIKLRCLNLVETKCPWEAVVQKLHGPERKHPRWDGRYIVQFVDTSHSAECRNSGAFSDVLTHVPANLLGEDPVRCRQDFPVFATRNPLLDHWCSFWNEEDFYDSTGYSRPEQVDFHFMAPETAAQWPRLPKPFWPHEQLPSPPSERPETAPSRHPSASPPTERLPASSSSQNPRALASEHPPASATQASPSSTSTGSQASSLIRPSSSSDHPTQQHQIADDVDEAYSSDSSICITNVVYAGRESRPRQLSPGVQLQKKAKRVHADVDGGDSSDSSTWSTKAVYGGSAGRYRKKQKRVHADVDEANLSDSSTWSIRAVYDGWAGRCPQRIKRVHFNPVVSSQAT
ncbi:unnamed protein product [Sympodiomycopsis kandeliae]